MPYLAVLLAASLTLIPGQTQTKQQPPPKKEKKVWMNEDLEGLRDKAGVSVVGQAAPPPSAQASTEEKPATPRAAAAPYVKQKDPKWYRERLAPLRAEAERIDSESRRLREFRASSRGTQAGIALGQNNIPLSPENQIQQLEARRREIQQQINAIEDQARHNGISPGSLR